MNKLLHFALLFVAVALAGADEKQAAQANGFRTWTDSSGKFQLEAKLLAVKDGKVTLHKRSGKQVSVPLDRLSNADRQYLESLQQPVEKPKTDQELIQGTWRGSRMEKDGRVQDKEITRFDPTEMTWTFTGNQIKDTSVSTSGQVLVREWTFKLDPSKKPKQILVIEIDGGTTMTSIYKIEKDTLTLCRAARGQPVPTDFTTKPGDKRKLGIYKREKKPQSEKD